MTGGKMRQNFASNSPFEPLVGFSRAVRVGNNIWVSGTVAWGAGGRIVEGDLYLQARTAIENIRLVLKEAGASLGDVVRTRIFVLDIAKWEEVARAHREAFGENPP